MAKGRVRKAAAQMKKDIRTVSKAAKKTVGKVGKAARKIDKPIQGLFSGLKW